jgi:hypothetical protein
MWCLCVFRKSVEEMQVSVQSDKITSTFHEDRYTFLFISRSFVLITINVLDRIVEEIRTHVLCSLTFFLNRAVYEIMRKSIESRVDHSRYGPCALHAGYLRLKTSQSEGKTRMFVCNCQHNKHIQTFVFYILHLHTQREYFAQRYKSQSECVTQFALPPQQWLC